jgi:hypothetical protein
MNFFLKTVGMGVVTAAGLVACGGGGDDANVNQAPMSQVAVKSIAHQGLRAIRISTNDDLGILVSLLTEYFITFSNSGTSSDSFPDVPCLINGQGSGSYSINLQKINTNQAGINFGDKLLISYNNCNYSDSKILYNGTIEVIAKNRMFGLSDEAFNTNYDVSLKRFFIQQGTIAPTTFNGIFNVSFRADSTSTDFKLTAPIDNGFTLNQEGNSIEYKKGAVFQATREAAGDSTKYRTRKLDGEFVVTTAGKTTRFSVSTPIPLSEKKIATSVDEFAATAGTMDVTDLDSGVTTSTTFSDTKAVIRTGGVSYDSTWAALSAAQ